MPTWLRSARISTAYRASSVSSRQRAATSPRFMPVSAGSQNSIGSGAMPSSAANDKKRRGELNVPTAHDRLPWGALRLSEAVATHLNFSTAADALNVTPAAVSQQIKALEGYIQVPLFRRNGRRVEITDEGLELLPAVRAGLEQLGSALQQIKHYRRAGPLQITTLASFLQIWLLPRIRSFRRKYPNIELRFHTSRELVDFSRTTNHVAIRFGRGDYPNLHSEKILDDWLVPVASPDLIKQYGMIERGTNLGKYPLLESGDEPGSAWSQTDEHAWLSRAPSIEDSAGLLAAAEEGLGY